MANTNQTYDRMKLEIQELREKMIWMDRSSLLEPAIDKKIAYGFLKEDPKSSRFIYRKYPALRDILKEICDPENPLYLPEVANELKGLIEVVGLKEDIESLEAEKKRLLQERSEVDNELKEQETKYNQLSAEAEELTKKLDDAQRLIGNLMSQEGRKRITDFYEAVKRFIEGVWKAQNGLPITERINSVRLNWDQINILKMLQKTVDMDLDYLTNKDLLSQEMFDQKRKEYKEMMDKEQDQALRAMDSFMSHNPVKLISKSIDSIKLVQKQLDQGEPDGAGVFFYLRGIGVMKENLNIPVNLLGNLQSQFETVKIRREGEK